MKKTFTILLMMLIASVGLVQAQVLEDFETHATIDGGAWGGYEGSYILNPEMTGNSSDTVWKVKKKWGAWDGSWVNFSTTSDYTAGTGLSMKVWSTKVGTSVMAKVENNSGGAKEIAASTTVAMAWETLNFDFSDAGTGYKNVVLFINGGTEMNLPDSILVDDIEFVTFTQSPKATIATLLQDGNDLSPHQTIFNYNVELAAGTTVVPNVTATAAHAGASVVVNDAAALPGTATVVITAEDGVSSITYSVNFTVAVGLANAAPTPPDRTASEVISIYSGAYTDVAGTDFNPGWGQSTVVTNGDVGGDEYMKYANLNFQGTAFGSDVNASDMEFLHVDMYTDNAAAPIKVFCISKSSGEKSVDLPITQGQWVSYDIPMTDFTSQGLSIDDLHQFKFDNGNGSTIYLDNIYFYREIPVGTDASLSDLTVDGTTVNGFAPTTFNYTVGLLEGTTTVPTVAFTKTDAAATTVVTDASSIPDTTKIVVTSASGAVTATYKVAFVIAIPVAGAPVPPARETADVISVYSDAYTDLEATNFNPGWGQSTQVSDYEVTTGDMIMEYNKLNYQGIQLASGQDVSGMEFVHVDMWTNDADAVINFFIIKEGQGVEHGHVLPITLGQWVSYDIPISVFGDKGIDLTAINQFKTTDELGANNANIFLDNIYFYKVPVVLNDDATLSDLAVDGTTVTAFDAATLDYTVELPAGTTLVPVVTATATDAANATAVVTGATVLPGTTSVLVTAEDGMTTKTYTVDFTLAVSVSTATMENTTIYAYEGMLYVNSDDLSISRSLEVFDITGRKLFNATISNSREQYRLNTSGVYIIKITDSETKQVLTEKVLAR